MSSRRVELQRGSSRFTPRASDGTYEPLLAELRRSRSNTGHPFRVGLTPREFEGLRTVEEVEERMRRVHAERMGLFDAGSEIPALNPGQQHLSDDDADRPRTKRIKLDSDDKRKGCRGVRYGHFGQVVPGTLEMEIVSCDGGSYETNGRSSWPGNILVNDNSVYCTKGDKCNIILRHPGEIPFTLRKLTIKAPKSGFDSPCSVQEGMVFVSMDVDNLLSSTAKYEFAYSASSFRSRRHQRSSDPCDMIASNRLSHSRRSLADPDAGDRGDTPLPDSSGQNSSSSNPHVRVTIDHDDRSDDETLDERRDRQPPLYGSHPDSTVELLIQGDTDTDSTQDSDADLDLTSTYHVFERLNERRLRDARREATILRDALRSPPAHRHRHGHSPVLSVDPLIRQSSSTEGEASSTPPEAMKPHTRFFIERGKSKVSIRFDPPASGRYILVKLWSPLRGGNIDIQSIIANGFAGLRYFPSTGLR